ncbi:MAG TPA: helix-turn-helix domain-containing protein [Phycisphaerae bacterium]|nr:helix-turn-helix domain-containing protein [Phycisphaerae bacterium]
MKHPQKRRRKAKVSVHPLAAYIASQEITQVEMARRIGISPQMLNDVLRGRSQMSGKTMLLVEEATARAVTASDLVAWRPAA